MVRPSRFEYASTPLQHFLASFSRSMQKVQGVHGEKMNYALHELLRRSSEGLPYHVGSSCIRGMSGSTVLY
jgi:hypothetical protein